MAYHQFTLDRVRKEFGLKIVDEIDIFGRFDPVDIGPTLHSLLEECVPLAVGIGTEKARSELIVTPMLLEARRRMGGAVGFFSGVEFHVDEARGLNGVCAYLLTKSRLKVLVTAPVLAVVEAKNDNVKPGLGQCAAEMVAVQSFNETEGEGPSTVFGAVTTGTAWRFLRLDRSELVLDPEEYAIDVPGKILAILLHCVGGRAA